MWVWASWPRATCSTDDGSYNVAYADSGSNVQGSLGQGNLTLQGAGAVAGAGDAISVGLLAGAGAGDASAIAGNAATSSNTQTVDNMATTGNATALNVNVVSVDQANTNEGDAFQGNAIGIAAIVYAGVGIGVIGQSNYVEVDGFYNGAFANTGDNAQFSGPQVNITGQLALAGAQGGGALVARPHRRRRLRGRRRFGCGERCRQQQLAAGRQQPDHRRSRPRSTHWRSPQRRRTATPATPTGVVLAAHPVFDSGAINQSNGALVQQVGNVAIANSGGNIQADGGQANVTRAGRG